MLGFGTRGELDGFLKDHGLVEGIPVEEIDRQMQDLNGYPVQNDLVARFQAFAAGHTLGGLDVKDLISEGRR